MNKYKIFYRDKDGLDNDIIEADIINITDDGDLFLYFKPEETVAIYPRGEWVKVIKEK